MMLPLMLMCALGAEDWSQFRGANSDGLVPASVASPLEWSETNNVAWKQPIPGLGWSSPVVVGERIYLTTAVPQGEGLSLRAMALEAATGSVVWDTEVRALAQTPAIHQKNSHASPTPIVRDGAVYVHFGTHGTARLKAETGQIEWTCLELVYAPMHGNGGSPVLHDQTLAIVCDGSKDPFVVGLDAQTGHIRWKTPRSVPARINHSFVTPTVTVVDGQAQLIAPGPDHCAAYDMTTGAEVWKLVAPGWSVVPQPVISDGVVIYNHDYDNPELLAVRLGGSGDLSDADIVWRLKRGAPSTPSPVLVGEELYFVSDKGIATCVNAATGQPLWTERLGGNFSASPVFANGLLLFLDENGKAVWLKPGPSFELVATNQLPGRTFATPAFAGHAMYLRTDEALYRIARD